MILDYDTAPGLTVDQKLKSLMESMQRALDETVTEIEALKKEVQKLKEES